MAKQQTQRIVREVELGVARHRRVADCAHQMLFNTYHIEARFMTYQAQDTSFTYLLTTSQRLTKAQIAEARTFVAGLNAMWHWLS